MTQPRTLIVVDGDHMDEILGASGIAVPGIDSMSQPFLAMLDTEYALILHGADQIHYPAVVLTTLPNQEIPPQTQAESIDILPPKGYSKGKAADHVPQEGISDES